MLPPFGVCTVHRSRPPGLLYGQTDLPFSSEGSSVSVGPPENSRDVSCSVIPMSMVEVAHL